MGDSVLPRRTFVFFGMLFAAGCATRKSMLVDSSRLPEPDWPDIPAPVMQGANGPVCPPPRELSVARQAPSGASSASSSAAPAAREQWVPGGIGRGPVPYAIPRSAWTTYRPDPSGMQRMLRPRYITIHHDGLPRAFTSAGSEEAGRRIAWVQTGHRGKGWADIGYHYVVDRSGRVWQCRDVLRWQGAHVSGRNEHNIGVMCLGNFELQKPSADQIDGLNHVVSTLRASYGIPVSNVRSHQEWKGAHTECPGDGLQPRVVQLRKSGFRAT
jgi:hypothetical protein